MTTTELAVGDSVRLEVHFQTGLRLGQVTKAIQIKTTFSLIAFYIPFKANIFEEVAPPTPVGFEPLKLFFSHFDVVRDSLAFLEVSNESDNEVSISLIDYPGDLLTVSDLSPIPAHDSVSCQIRLLDPEFTEPFYKSITFEVEDNYRFTIPIIGEYIDSGKVARPAESGVDCGGRN